MDAEEEYSESNTIFGAFRESVPGSMAELAGSDARAIFGIRGECWVNSYPLCSATNTTARSLVTVWD